MGAAVWCGLRRRLAPPADAPAWRKWALAAVVAGLSLLPDGDAVLGIFFGDFGRYHNNWTHSLLLIPIIGIVAAAALQWLVGLRFRDGFLLAVLCAGAHDIMDFFTVGRGVMLLWPLTAARFQSPVLLFYGLHWSQPWNSPSHWVTLVNELAWIGFVVSLWVMVRARRRMALNGEQKPAGNEAGPKEI
jgi:membrane-bound metal-dependent hydrolase YbcI (DUF457 family)